MVHNSSVMWAPNFQTKTRQISKRKRAKFPNKNKKYTDIQKNVYLCKKYNFLWNIEAE